MWFIFMLVKRSLFYIVLGFLGLMMLFSLHSYANSKIKDIVNFEGVRENMLVGYGLVSGLDGTGDNLQNASFTQKGLINLLEKLGVNTRGENIKTKNVAAVMVIATLPAFSRSGSRISVNLSTLGDAKSLKGGTLLATPLMGLDGMIYAVAQGQVSIGKLSDTKQENFRPILTSGYIINGALVEKEIHFKLNSLSNVNIALKNPDITTARAIASAINSHIGNSIAKAQDPGTISLDVPAKYQDNVIELLADIENITVMPHTVAKIIIDEATGTVVVNKNVQISKVAIAQKNLIVKVTALDESGIEERLFFHDKTKVQNPGTAFKILERTANLTDLVQGLNSLGVKPQDLIIILKSIQQAGALQAVIEVR